MKRFHVHVGVEKLDESIRFYTALFGAEPVKAKTDYAKWLLEDPRVNFAISTRAKKKGVDHLGIQVEGHLAPGQVGVEAVARRDHHRDRGRPVGVALRAHVRVRRLVPPDLRGRAR